MKYFKVVILIIFLGCNMKPTAEKEQKYLNAKSFYKDEFVNHFPKSFDGVNYPFQFYANYSNKHEAIYMGFSASFDKEKIKNLRDSISIISKAVYTSKDTCLLIVNRYHLKNNFYKGIKLTDVEKGIVDLECYENKLPIQNFYFDMYLSDETPYHLPSDFVLYVLEAKSGKYWDDKYLYGGKYMPPEWEHGYSKGIAISGLTTVVIYWFVIW